MKTYIKTMMHADLEAWLEGIDCDVEKIGKYDDNYFADATDNTFIITRREK